MIRQVASAIYHIHSEGAVHLGKVYVMMLYYFNTSNINKTVDAICDMISLSLFHFVLCVASI